jgi:SAM-dependent methyltransferase
MVSLGPLFWRAYAATYDGLESLGEYRRLCDDTVTAARITPGVRVAEVGCGTGSVTARLVAAGAEVSAVDASTAMLSRALRRCPSVAFTCADALDWLRSLDDSSVDRVVSQNLLYLLEDRPAFWAETRRVLRPDGFAVVATPTTAGNSSLWSQHLRDAPWRDKFPPRLAAAGALSLCISAGEHAGDLGTVDVDTHLDELAAAGAEVSDCVACYGPPGGELDHRFVVRWP